MVVQHGHGSGDQGKVSRFLYPLNGKFPECVACCHLNLLFVLLFPCSKSSWLSCWTRFTGHCHWRCRTCSTSADLTSCRRMFTALCIETVWAASVCVIYAQKHTHTLTQWIKIRDTQAPIVDTIAFMDTDVQVHTQCILAYIHRDKDARTRTIT